MFQPTFKSTYIPNMLPVTFRYYYDKTLKIPKNYLFNTEIIPVIYDDNDEEYSLFIRYISGSRWGNYYEIRGDDEILYNGYKYPGAFGEGAIEDRTKYYKDGCAYWTADLDAALFYGDKIIFVPEYEYVCDGSCMPYYEAWFPIGGPDPITVYPPYEEINVRKNLPDVEFFEGVYDDRFSKQTALENKKGFFEIEKNEYKIICRGWITKKTQKFNVRYNYFDTYDDIYAPEIYEVPAEDGKTWGWKYILKSHTVNKRL